MLMLTDRFQLIARLFVNTQRVNSQRTMQYCRLVGESKGAIAWDRQHNKESMLPTVTHFIHVSIAHESYSSGQKITFK